MGPAAGRAVAFGDFTFDRVTQILRRQEVEIPLPPRVLGVLRLLLDQPGEIVTKQALISGVWRDAFVTETSIAEAVSVLRQALGDDTQRPTYVQTLHRRGYRFIAEVQEIDARPRSRGPAPLADAAVAAPPPTATPVEPDPRLSLLVPWILTGVAMLTAASAVWKYVDTTTPAAPQSVQFAIALPEGLTVAPDPAPLAVSRDGALIAFSGCDDGRCAIYLRPLSQPDPTLVAGTTGGRAPFFSADGQTLGFFAAGQLRRITLGGGSPVRIADAAEALGAAWLADGRIVFARTRGEGLFVVEAGGQGLRALTTPAPGDGHRWPVAVPDGEAVLFTVGAGDGRDAYAASASMRTGAWSRLLDNVGAVQLPAPGYVVGQRGDGLVAARFDAAAHSIDGLAVGVPGPRLTAAAPQFAAGADGLLVASAADRRALHVILHWTGDLRRLVPVPQPSLPR